MRCTLILVGTELLNGATLDTNSVFMAEELNKVGIKIDFKLTVGDSLEKIEKYIISLYWFYQYSKKRSSQGFSFFMAHLFIENRFTTLFTKIRQFSKIEIDRMPI